MLQAARAAAAGAGLLGLAAVNFFGRERGVAFAAGAGDAKTKPDPTDCHNPVCGSKSAMFFNMTQNKGSAQSSKKSGGSSNQPGGHSDSYADDPPEAMSDGDFVGSGCPVDREELGRQSWTFLHTMAAYYPDTPSLDEQQRMKNMIEALSWFYPCQHCAAALRTSLEQKPPAVASRKELSLWMCEAHNEVSRQLGKPTVKCSIEALDRRWRTGRAECWPSEGTTAEDTLEL
eukprot:INCI14384.2.p1 GENE.INCI14384.2~~INCI14384.2.p1  ORF type:complete len:231 (+),score=51.95 INCI14384.2:693-1385(+)